MKLIAKNENLELGSNIIEYLVEISEGDLRKSINMLQSIAQLPIDLLNNQVVDDICGIIPKDLMESVREVISIGNTHKILDLTKEIMLNGYDSIQLLIQLNESFLAVEDLSDNQKISITNHILDTHDALLANASPHIQLINLFIKINNEVTLNI